MSDMYYTPNGTPLTDHERELLVVLMEECAEVTQAASKLIRFGKENRPDGGEPNTRVLALEIGDLLHMVDLVAEARLVSSQAAIDEGVGRKAQRFAKYQQHRS